MISFIMSPLAKLIVPLLAAAAIFFIGAQWVANVEREAIRVKQLEVFVKTTEVIKNVEVSPTRAVAIERLHHNGWVR